MKNEFENNLTEPFETDDLGIRTSMENIEPEAGARERMLQNIMKKAAAAQAAEGVKAAFEEAPKAEILSISAANEAAKKNTAKKQKSRWKQYLPMLIAAGLIMTVGLAFFSVYGIGKLGTKDAASNMTGAHYADEKEAAEAQGNPKTDGMKPANEMPDVVADVPTNAAEPAGTDAPDDAVTDQTNASAGAIEPGVVDAPEFTVSPDNELHHDAETPGETQNDSNMVPNPTAAPTDAPANVTNAPATEAPVSEHTDGNDSKTATSEYEGEEGPQQTNPREGASPNGWRSLTSARKALSDAAKGLEIVKFSEEDSKEDYVTLSYEGHEYRLQYMENGQIELPWDPDTEQVAVDGQDNLTLMRKKETGVSWLAEWSLDQTNWYYLWNQEEASEEEVLELINTLTENAREAAK